MTGSPAERAVLGSVLMDPKVYRFAADVVSADDFEDQRLGAIFAGMGRLLAVGAPVNEIAIGNHFPEWQIRGIEPGEVFTWTDNVAHAQSISQYGIAVRDAAIRRGLRDIGTRVVANAANPSWASPDAVSKAISELERLRESASTSMFVAKKLSAILDGSDEYDWVIPNLLERKDRLILTGGEGAGKTTFVRQLAILSAAGIHPTNFTPIEPVRVLVVDAENTERQWRRAVRWMTNTAAREGSADPGETVRVMASHRIDITKEQHLGEVHRLVDLHKPDVLFIGPLYKLVPGAINNDDDAAPLIVALDSLRDRDIALVMEAHAGKSTGGDGERELRPRGSSALLGWPEFGMGLRVTDASGMVQVVKWRGDRDVRDFPRYMQRGGAWPWMPSIG
ncbi:AAA family ATPase [Glaciihabitans sp. dw_435]|uniref:AAA family ATPase n=1 Tax=Glaciihabitans sp. dw_435 TaxID=2720081 RepID=UPI001BD43CEC|nr:AAA family ATPase [Glaciihabitans sp. dw_435]